MGVASGCGEQEVGVASGSGWNLWLWLLGVVLRRYIDFLILLIPTPLVSVLFCSSIPTSFFILGIGYIRRCRLISTVYIGIGYIPTCRLISTVYIGIGYIRRCRLSTLHRV